MNLCIVAGIAGYLGPDLVGVGDIAGWSGLGVRSCENGAREAVKALCRHGVDGFRQIDQAWTFGPEMHEIQQRLLAVAAEASRLKRVEEDRFGQVVRRGQESGWRWR